LDKERLFADRIDGERSARRETAVSVVDKLDPIPGIDDAQELLGRWTTIASR